MDGRTNERMLSYTLSTVGEVVFVCSCLIVFRNIDITNNIDSTRSINPIFRDRDSQVMSSFPVCD